MATHGTPRYCAFNAFFLSQIPEPGARPASVICTVLHIWNMSSAIRESIRITPAGENSFTAARTSRPGSMPVRPSVPGESRKSSFSPKLLQKVLAITFGPMESAVKKLLPNPTARIFPSFGKSSRSSAATASASSSKFSYGRRGESASMVTYLPAGF